MKRRNSNACLVVLRWCDLLGPPLHSAAAAALLLLCGVPLINQLIAITLDKRIKSEK